MNDFDYLNGAKCTPRANGECVLARRICLATKCGQMKRMEIVENVCLCVCSKSHCLVMQSDDEHFIINYDSVSAVWIHETCIVLFVDTLQRQPECECRSCVLR